MSTSSTASSSGIGLGGLLTLIFVIAKVFNIPPVAEWSWLWVLCPLWIPVVFTLAVIVTVIAVAFILVVLKAIFQN